MPFRYWLFLSFVSMFHFFLPGGALAEEPTLRQLEKAALHYAGGDPEEIARWKRRSRLSAALPKLIAGYDQKVATQINNNIQDSISVSSAGVSIGPPQTTVHQDDNFNRGFEVKAQWELSELVFSKDELAISSEARYRTILRSQIIEELQQTYFERKRILAKEADGKSADLPEAARLRLEELEARLDSLTGGFFSKTRQGDPNEK
ncbi:MAG: hypothetical protein U1F57_02885 [bacterium]